ncbi:MAG: type II toxin-antitoxin system HipA family toxin [Actinomycetota bacterium]|nr:type II toxin-antitoxin system HipA family toxin [Actinomycetota bacterium]
MTEPKDKWLHVLINAEQIGVLEQGPHGRLSFRYEESWRERRDATPLSLSMPVSGREHSNAVVEPFLRGLLPDNENVLRRWGRRFGVPWNSPFAQLRNVGEDVAGAAQFVRESRLDEATTPGEIKAIDDAYIDDRLRMLRGDRAAWDDIDAPGQFSLAGAQAKFALHRSLDGQWGLPSGRSATTHILKPSLEYLAHQEVNEHLCLRAAGTLGMRAASSEVIAFGEERAIVLERYDRIRQPDGSVTRVHQEDMCQALGVYPDRKYEREDGGLGAVDVVALLREHIPPSQAIEAIEIFCRALAFNWVIYGPDAHAKNYSLLMSGPNVRLAPLYDISSVAPYPDRYDLRHMAMAMSINTKFQNSLITGEDWRQLARTLNIDPDRMTSWVHDVVSNAPDALADAVRAEDDWIANLEMARQLVDGVASNAKALARWIELPIASPGTSVTQRPTKPTVAAYRKADGTYVKEYPNPRHRS